ncbi:glycine cleavage system protein H [Paucilactobacillus wasatchensis]|uniref:Glycine cleavage H-protein n=1 Tax=Paucilactobacillus wasatchensis TaxID=1335616 RepID=A0A0D1A964_9LACO|nr:glycine cleavage system protein H [Paucilactobacillus wasatchensis]KIS04237.1 Glycine cleavage H-protein [Paucilactobacillus wasatchensis]
MSATANYFWTKKQDDGTIRIGLSDAGVDDLGKINFADVPATGTKLTTDGPFVSVEAEKAVSDLPSPLTGVISQINPALSEGPEALNSGNLTDRWFVDVK